MYSYQHRYHAGNFADLHKHLVLLAVLEALQKKEAPFCVLDAYAGEGVYDLNSKESQKNQEYRSGFGKVQAETDAPHLLQELLDIAKESQAKNRAVVYPGSPAIIYSKLRPQDQAIFIENHPAAYLELKKHFGHKPQAHIHRRDAIEAINALVPFKEKRGLIFLDPSYEIKDEYQMVADIVQRTHRKFSHGIYMIWYPLLQAGRHIILCEELQRRFQNIWQHEWIPAKNEMDGLYGSGIIIVNPPWLLDSMVGESLRFLTA